MTARRTISILLGTGAAVLGILAMPLLLLRAQVLTVGGYQLVTERRISRTVSEYTYTAVLTNPGPALAGATARVTSRSVSTVVVDADLTFGAVPSTGSAASLDTFSFQQDRTVNFNPADLVWTVTPVATNRPPNAVIAPVGPVFVTQLVALDGTQSADPDGGPLTYQWSLVTRPAASNAAVNASTSARASFLPDRAGTYVVRLEVSDGQLTDTVDLPLTTSNSPPRANAGPDQTVMRNAVVTLDGSGSSDADGDPLTYQWTFLSRPTGSTAVLSNTTVVRPTFVVDLVGAYEVRLVVDDGRTSSQADVVIVNTGNSPPVANAGPDRTVTHGATVQLNASGSSDVDGDPLTYLWAIVTRPPGSAAVLSGASTVQPTFVADQVGLYELRLTVSDGQAAGQDDVTITTVNSRPVANAGPDRAAAIGATVGLDGSASTDVDGDPLTYQWSLVTKPIGSTAVLSNPAAVTPSFVVDRLGEYVAQLIVNDGVAASEPDSVTVIAGTEDRRPLADAGPNQSVSVGTVVLLDGSGSNDPDGDALTYMWSLTTVPAGSTAVLSNPAGVTPTFIADRPGAYLAQLVVSDGLLSSVPDTVIVTTTMNTAPVADAGADLTNVTVGQLITLDGSGSRDADGHPLTFQWSLSSVPEGSRATLSNPTTVRPTLRPDVSGSYVAQLIVNDGFLSSDPDTVQVQVRSVNRPPLANAGPDRSVTVGTSVSLDGRASTDPDGDPLTYIWTLTSTPPGSSAALLNATSATPELTPDVSGFYVVTLVVNDGTANSVADSTTLSATGGPASPTIAGFTPSSGRGGDVVTVSGTNFTGVQSVTFNGVAAPGFTVVSSTSLNVPVPAVATTGPIAVTTAAGSATSAGHFVVLSSQDFELTVSPDIVTVPVGGHGAFQVSVTGTNGFSNLATLAVSGVPAPAAASFGSPTLTSGQSTQLTLQTGSVSSGTIPLTVTATARVNDVETTRTATVTVQVAAAGVTSIAGQFLTVSGVPIPNVLVNIGAVQAHSDAAGNFLLQNVIEGPQALMIDANVAVAGYPIYKVDLQIVAGQLLTLPTFRITPPPPPERFVPFSNATQDQIITDPRYPGFELTLPRGARIIGWDGTPKTKAAIERILPSQLPVPPPPGPTQSLYQIHFGTPMGGIPSARLPVTLPNDQGLEPGQQGEIWWYDAAPTGGPGAWKMAGMGTVSADGTKVVSNPGVGIDRFCGVCGLVCFINRILGQDNRNPDSPFGGDPVDLALGQMIENKTDMVLPGRRLALVHRTYNPLDPFGAIAGFELALGPGWALSVDVVLLEVNPLVRRLILPGNARFDFLLQPNGTYTQATHQRFAGAVLTVLGGGGNQLRFKDGAVWRFANSFIAGVDVLVEESDRNGNRLAIERDSRAAIRRLVEPSGRALSFAYSDGRLSQVTDPLGRVIRYGYNSQRRLETVTDPTGGVTRYTYNAAGGIVTVTDARNIEYLRNEYSPLSGRILRQIQADGGVWNFKYQVLPRVLVAVPMALNPAAVEESAETVAAGLTGDLRNPPITTTVIDPRGNSRSYSMFAGLVDAVTDGLGQRTRFERSGNGQVVSAIDPLGRVTRLDYDAHGNVVRITDPEGHVTGFDYEPAFNQVTRMTDPLGNITTVGYDDHGNVTSVTDAEQNGRPEAERLSMSITYDDLHQPIAIRDPLGNVTSLVYDARGNLVSVLDALGNVSSLAYDLVSRITAHTDPRGRTTAFTYDALNRLNGITDGAGGQTRLAFDGNGNLLSVTDARSNTVQYEYDGMDRLTRRIDPLSRSETFAYDANGNLTSTTDRKGQTTTFTYDTLDRRVRSQFADGAVIALQYDAAGRLAAVDDSADPHRPMTFAFDVLDRLVSETTALGSVRYSYDAIGRRTEMLASGRQPVFYEYDRNSRLRTVTQAPMPSATFDYDAASRRTRLTLPNGVSTDYQYDQASRLTDLIYRNALGQLGTLTYQYDRAGNRVGVGGSLARSTLPSAVNAAAYDAANQQQQFGDRQLAYDANGNLDSLTDLGGQTQFGWDARNRLVRLNGPGTAATFAYDALGRRAARDINGTRTQYAYDGVDFIAEITNSGSVSYLRSLFIDEPLVRNGSEYYAADVLGSTVALTTAAGTLATQYSYGPFGATSVAGASDNPAQYTSRENDGTGLYFYRARYYSPTLHRYIAEDPLEFAGGDPNVYAYVANGPTNAVDPFGECPQCAAGAAVGGAVGLAFQIGSDIMHGQLSSFSQYAGAVAGGAAGGAAATVCGPACAGAVAAATSNLVTNGLNGQFCPVGLVTDTAMGAAFGGVAGRIIPSVFSRVSNGTKGNIGEGLTRLDLGLRGNINVASQVRNGVGKSTFDFQLSSGQFVEAKFGTAGLSGPQRVAARRLGGALEVQRWTYPTVSGLGSSGAAGLAGRCK